MRNSDLLAVALIIHSLNFLGKNKKNMGEGLKPFVRLTPRWVFLENRFSE